MGNSHSTAQLEKRAKKQSESKLRAQSSAKKQASEASAKAMSESREKAAIEAAKKAFNGIDIIVSHNGTFSSQPDGSMTAHDYSGV